jgi:hypothetical protein
VKTARYSAANLKFSCFLRYQEPCHAAVWRAARLAFSFAHIELGRYTEVPPPSAGVAKLADARDSKSREAYVSCGFDSHLRHHSTRSLTSFAPSLMASRVEWCPERAHRAEASRRAYQQEESRSQKPEARSQKPEGRRGKADFRLFSCSNLTLAFGSPNRDSTLQATESNVLSERSESKDYPCRRAATRRCQLAGELLVEDFAAHAGGRLAPLGRRW